MLMTSRLTETSNVSIRLASELELERGVAVVGSAWTTDELRDYARSRKQFVYCWSDDIHESVHYHEGVANGDGTIPDEKWCNYRVCVGLRYGVETDSEGVVHYRSKMIDHMVVDASLGHEKLVRYFHEVIDGLASRWASDQMGKLIVNINDKDTFSLKVFKAAGFRETASTQVEGDWTIRLEYCKKD